MTALDIQGSLSPHAHPARQAPLARRLASGTSPARPAAAA